MATSAKALPTPDPNNDSTHTNDSADTKRVNVIFSKEQYAALQGLAESQGINVSDALRQAINVSKLIVDANADKDTQILIKKGDSISELKIVR